jgi:hypothetical protein
VSDIPQVHETGVKLATRSVFPVDQQIGLATRSVRFSSPAHSLAIGSDPGRRSLSARNPVIETKFSDRMQGKTEQFTTRQHIATHGSPRKHCSKRNQHYAQRRNGKGGRRCAQQKHHAAKYPAEGCDHHEQRQQRHAMSIASAARPSLPPRSVSTSAPNQVDDILEMTFSQR